MDEAGERTEFFPGLCDHVPAVSGIRNIGAHRDEARRVIVQPFRRHRLQVGTAHLVARCEQALHAGEADAARGAGYDNDFGAFACHRIPTQTSAQPILFAVSVTHLLSRGSTNQPGQRRGGCARAANACVVSFWLRH